MTNVGPEFSEELKVREAGKLSRTIRSGGPCPAAGKLLYAKNSPKTGTYSNLLVPSGESREDYLGLDRIKMFNFSSKSLVLIRRTSSHLDVESGKSNMGSVGARCNLLWVERNPPWARFSGGSRQLKESGIEVQILG